MDLLKRLRGRCMQSFQYLRLLQRPPCRRRRLPPRTYVEELWVEVADADNLVGR